MTDLTCLIEGATVSSGEETVPASASIY